ncbi:MAG: hypothetical protein R3A79_00180 [Nannocystaceae bacterium]
MVSPRRARLLPRAAALAGLLLAPLACQQLPTEDPTTASSDGSDSDGSASGSTTSSMTGDPTNSSSDPTPEYNCDPADLGSCPDGEKCTAVVKGTYQNLYECVVDDTSVDPYSECVPSPNDGQDGCPPSTICAPSSGEENIGLCVPLCVKHSECGDGRCLENPYNNVQVCADACDPLVPICKGTLECRQTDDSFACQQPTEVDIGTETAQCLSAGDRGCSQGFVCEAGELIPNCTSPTGLCCTAICDLTAPDICAAPATCNDAFTSPAPGYEWVGACFVPS